MPGAPTPIPVPVAIMDRKPEGGESVLFDWSPATGYDGIPIVLDVPRTRLIAKAALRGMERWAELLAAG